jgi:hypothetical protein
MDTNPLVTEETDAGAELVRRLRKSMPVETAFWLNPAAYGKWELNIATPEVDAGNYDHGYGEILRLVQEMHTPYIDPFQVRLIGTENPLTKAAVEMNRRFPGPVPTRFRGKHFGGIPVEEVYIYPEKDFVPVC